MCQIHHILVVGQDQVEAEGVVGLPLLAGRALMVADAAACSQPPQSLQAVSDFYLVHTSVLNQSGIVPLGCEQELYMYTRTVTRRVHVINSKLQVGCIARRPTCILQTGIQQFCVCLHGAKLGSEAKLRSAICRTH